MMRNNSLKKDYLFSVLIRGDEGFPWRILSVLIFISLLPFVGAILDRSLYLPGKVLGLLEHYGNVSFAVVLPLVFLFAARGIRYFDDFMSNIDSVLLQERFVKKIRLDKFLHAYWAEDPYWALKALPISVGFTFATINAINALKPDGVWGHDVYDSSNHIFGYVSQRVFFYVWWGYVLPVLVYRLFIIVVTLDKLFSPIIETDSLAIQPVNPDNAGGLGRIGKMALSSNLAILATMIISASLYYAHGYDGPLVAGMIVQFLLLPVVFFLPLLPVHRAMKIKKRTLLLAVSKHHNGVSNILLQRFGRGDGTFLEKL